MLSTPHILTGAAIGAVAAPLGLPAVFCFAVLSHLALDLMPHTDDLLLEEPFSDKYSANDILSVIIEIVTGIIIVSYFVFKSSVPFALVVGALGGLTIDLIDNVPFWKGIRNLLIFKQLHQFHEMFDGAVRKKWKIVGVATQFIIIAVAVSILMQNS
jgi:hypothetical protein